MLHIYIIHAHVAAAAPPGDNRAASSSAFACVMELRQAVSQRRRNVCAATPGTFHEHVVIYVTVRCTSSVSPAHTPSHSSSFAGVSVLIVESPPSHVASLAASPPPLSLQLNMHGSRTLAGSYMQQQHQQQQQQLKAQSFSIPAPMPLHTTSPAPDTSLIALGGDCFSGCEPASPSDAAIDPIPPAAPTAIFWNAAALPPPSHSSAAELILTLRFQVASHLQLPAAVPVYITGCCSSNLDSEIAAVATTTLLDCSTPRDAGQRLATELLLWCCQNPRSYVLVACNTDEVLRACRRLALCGNRVVLAYSSGSSSSLGNVCLLEWNSLCSGLAELPPPPSAPHPASSSSNDDISIIRFIHSILIDAPVSGLTIDELRHAHSHSRSLSSSAPSPPPFDASPLGFNNFIEFLMCNYDYFVTQWDADIGKIFLMQMLRSLVDCARRRIQSSSRGWHVARHLF